MNLTVDESIALVEEIQAQLPPLDRVQVVVAPPFTALDAVRKRIEGGPIKLAAQNLHWEPAGAFTGEISAEQLVDIGCRLVIIGHSERRQYFGETDRSVNKRIQAALQAGLQPILCIGETLEERENRKTLAIIERQLKGALTSLTVQDLKDLVIAYEPVWAIGTGKVASPEIAQEVHQFIRQQLNRLDADWGETIPLLYGGSVKPENARGLFSQPDIDGGLVGGASLRAKDFISIVKNAITALAL